MMLSRRELFQRAGAAAVAAAVPLPLAAAISAPAARPLSIANITVDAFEMVVTLEDGQTIGPITLPQRHWNLAGLDYLKRVGAFTFAS